MTDCLGLGEREGGGRRVLQGQEQVSVEDAVQHKLLEGVRGQQPLPRRQIPHKLDTAPKLPLEKAVFLRRRICQLPVEGDR